MCRQLIRGDHEIFDQFLRAVFLIIAQITQPAGIEYGARLARLEIQRTQLVASLPKCLGGSILHTDDGGMSWTRQDTPTQVSLFGIEPVGERLFVVGGEGTVLAYRDGTWHNVEHGQAIRLYIRAITALDDKHCLVGGVGGALHIIDISGA